MENGNEDKVEAPISIPPDGLIAFLKTRNAKIECPVCGVSDWVNMEDDQNLGFLVHAQSKAGTPGAKVLPLTAIVCKNCHYVWLMARRPLEAWIREHANGDN